MKPFSLYDQKVKTKTFTIFIIFKGRSVKQIANFFLEGESRTLIILYTWSNFWQHFGRMKIQTFPILFGQGINFLQPLSQFPNRTEGDNTENRLCQGGGGGKISNETC